VCCHLFVVGGLCTSVTRIAMLAGVSILLIGPPKSDRLKGRDQTKEQHSFCLSLLYYFSPLHYSTFISPFSVIYSSVYNLVALLGRKATFSTIEFGGRIFQQTVGIPMGTNCAPLLVDLFLHSQEAEFVQELLPTLKCWHSQDQEHCKKQLLLWSSVCNLHQSRYMHSGS